MNPITYLYKLHHFCSSSYYLPCSHQSYHFFSFKFSNSIELSVLIPLSHLSSEKKLNILQYLFFRPKPNTHYNYFKCFESVSPPMTTLPTPATSLSIPLKRNWIKMAVSSILLIISNYKNKSGRVQWKDEWTFISFY